jgi:hypothetical protein
MLREMPRYDPAFNACRPAGGEVDEEGQVLSLVKRPFRRSRRAHRQDKAQSDI